MTLWSTSFNPRSPCGERRPHSPMRPGRIRFNPRSPCGERRNPNTSNLPPLWFQSTLSVWRATNEVRRQVQVYMVSIHALRVESDCAELVPLWENVLFQSTLSVWRATAFANHFDQLRVVSIHALRVESDHCLPRERANATQRFNPRSPCGERPNVRVEELSSSMFQSTLSVWRATACMWDRYRIPFRFNPRSPCGERLDLCASLDSQVKFQSTLSVWRATKASLETGQRRVRFNPRSPCGERPPKG